MRLWPVEWFTVSTAITQSPQPSTLLMTPRLDVHGTPTFSSPISTATTPWWTTTQRKSVVRLGQQAFGNLSHH